jgi:hypothetical protein
MFADTRANHAPGTALKEFDPHTNDAHQLQATLWKLFEVDGKPSPKVGNHLRVRTLYLEGANRADLTPNVLRGRVLSFDNMSKSEMLAERTIMYRLFQPTTSPVEILSHAAKARKLSGRFDMRVDDESRGRLAGFEPEYRQIFLDLGYDIAPVEEDHKAFRINPVVTDTGSDIEETEFIIE